MTVKEEPTTLHDALTDLEYIEGKKREVNREITALQALLNCREHLVACMTALRFENNTRLKNDYIAYIVKDAQEYLERMEGLR